MASSAATDERQTWGHGSRCIGRTPEGHLRRCKGVELAEPAPRPRFLETVGAGASVSVLRVMPQVACRPLGASLFDARTVAAA